MSFQSSPPVSSTQLWRDGLWNQNPALVKLLGLCPLLAVSNTATNGLGLGLATLITLLVANGLVSALRQTIMPAVRIPVYVLIIASTVTTIEFLIQAYLPALHTTLGIFLPLIVTNCLIMARSEAFASRQRIAPAIHDALAMGTGFMIVLVTTRCVARVHWPGHVARGCDATIRRISPTLDITGLQRRPWHAAGITTTWGVYRVRINARS